MYPIENKKTFSVAAHIVNFYSNVKESSAVAPYVISTNYPAPRSPSLTAPFIIGTISGINTSLGKEDKPVNATLNYIASVVSHV